VSWLVGWLLVWCGLVGTTGASANTQIASACWGRGKGGLESTSLDLAPLVLLLVLGRRRWLLGHGVPERRPSAVRPLLLLLLLRVGRPAIAVLLMLLCRLLLPRLRLLIVLVLQQVLRGRHDLGPEPAPEPAPFLLLLLLPRRQLLPRRVRALPRPGRVLRLRRAVAGPAGGQSRRGRGGGRGRRRHAAVPVRRWVLLLLMVRRRRLLLRVGWRPLLFPRRVVPPLLPVWVVTRARVA
jgi:hypothetical protein